MRRGSTITSAGVSADRDRGGGLEPLCRDVRLDNVDFGDVANDDALPSPSPARPRGRAARR
jgi:hypothetical protein